MTQDGCERVVEGRSSSSVMQAIRDAGIDELLAICFGCCSCGLCHVYVEGGARDLPPMSEDEDYVLRGVAYRTTQSRLSCQLRVTEAIDGLRVRLAPED